ncbi:MAG: hypothetical protein R8J85_05045 [Mariprofundales bacterium]
MNFIDRRNKTLSFGSALMALLFALVVSAMPAFADDKKDKKDKLSNDVEVNEDTVWEEVTDSSSLIVSGNCISFTEATSYEAELESYENEMKAVENTKKDEENSKETEYDNLANIENESISDEDNENDPHVIKKHEYEALSNEANEAKDEHNSSKDEHNSKHDMHHTKKEKYDESKVPSGTTACKTPGGVLGFLPASAAGSKATPSKKALRELFGN